MSPRVRAARGVVAALVMVLGLLASTTSPVAAAPRPSSARQASGIRIEQVTPWVAPDGDWTVRFSGMGAVPPGTVVSFTVHRQLSGTASAVRERITDILDGGSPGAGLQNEVRTTLEGPPADGIYQLVVPIRPRSGDESRVLLPNPGVPPVELSVEAPDGTTLFATTTFLNRLPARDARGPLLLATTLDVGVGPVLTPQGEIDVDAEQLDHLESDSAILEAAEFPVTVSLDPSLAEMLAQTPTAVSTYERLVNAVSPSVLVRRPWVPIDLTAWSAPSALGEVRSQLVAGDRALSGIEGPVRDDATWTLDGTVSAEALPALSELGFERLLVSDGQLVQDDDTPTPSEALRPVTVRQGASTAVALSTDPLAQVLLAGGPDDRDADALRVTAAISTILASWGATTGTDPSGAVLTFDPMPPERAVVLAASLSEAPTELVQLTDAASVFEDVSPLTRRRGRSTDTVTLALKGNGSPVTETTLRRIRGVRTALSAYRSMMDELPAPIRMDQRILLSEHRDFDDAARAAALAELEARIGADVAQITGPRDRSITLTARRAEIPLRIENGLERSVEVQILVQSSRLVVEGGSRQTVRLAPGTNRINVPVTVRTSGQFTVDVAVRSVDGVLALNTARIRVRSQVFSGVGIALGSGALAFLVGWWFVTHRRRRREESDVTDVG